MLKIFTKRESDIYKELKKSKYLSNIKDIESQILSNEPVIKYRYKDFDLFINNESAAIFHIVNSVQKIENLANSVILKDCNIIFDIGANVGLYSYFCNIKYPDAKYYLFEADIKLLDVINNNCKNIKYLNVYNLAISNSNDKQIKFYINPESAQTNSTFKEYLHLFGDVSSEILVETIKLDQFCKDNNIKNIDILKIDIQGGELDALISGSNILYNTDCLQLELCFAFNNTLDIISFANKYFKKFEIVNEIYKGFDINLYK
jgi:FkbM family methyltransferase